jgi:hypothetical protein
MTTQEYRDLWQQAIRLCELETNKEEATEFIYSYYDGNTRKFSTMDDRELILTFIGLVVYEQKFQVKMGSTTPTSACFYELWSRTNNSRLDKEFILDMGDWAAEYSDNGYVPMGNYRGYGPRRYFGFVAECNMRVRAEKEAKIVRLEQRREEGKRKVEIAQQDHLNRLDVLQNLRNKEINDAIDIIEQSEKSVFYYIELIEEWFANNLLETKQRERVLALFPTKSTKHNRRTLQRLLQY